MEQKQECPLQKMVIFHQVCLFLNIEDIVKLMRLNKYFLELSNEHFKIILRKEGNLKEVLDGYTDYTQKIKYNLLYQYFHNKEILYTSLENPITIHNQKDMKVYRKIQEKGNFLKKQGIKKFRISHKWSAFWTFESTLLICKTNDLFSNTTELNILTRKNVKQFSTKPKDLVYLLNDGTVHTIFYDEQLPISELNEKIIPWTKDIPVKQIKASYSFVLFVIDENEQTVNHNTYLFDKILSQGFGKYQQQLLGEEQKQEQIQQEQEQQQQQNEQSQEEQQKSSQQQETKQEGNYKQNELIVDTKLNMIVFSINQLTVQDLLDKERYKRITNYEYNQVLDVAVGGNHIYILSPDHLVFELDLYHFQNKQLNNTHLSLRYFSFLANKYIIKLECGLNFYFAYERNDSQSLDTWDNQQVLKFIDDLNFDEDYLKIMKQTQFNGKMLAQLDKQYMMDTIGMRQDHYQKIVYETGEIKQKLFDKQTLYAWGKNDTGQLGVQNLNLIKYPVIVQLPELKQNDFIKKIVCGWENTVIMTKFSRVFITDKTSKKEIKEQQKQQQQDQEEKKDANESQQNKKGTNFYKDKKETQNRKKSAGGHKQEKNSQQEQQSQEENNQVQVQSRWIEITKNFAQLKDQRKYHLYDISLSKDKLCVLGSCYDTKILQSLRQTSVDKQSDNSIQNNNNNEERQEEKKKLKTSAQILDWISFDRQFQKRDFSVVYEDRFLNKVEIPLKEFEKSDAKTHRIRQFKFKGEVIWDCEQRLDNFKYYFN